MDRVLAFFARRTLDPQVAADLTAETFADAYMHRSRIEDRGDLGAAWLFGVARHKLAHYYRRGRVEERARRKLAITTPLLAPADLEQLDDHAGLTETRGLIREAIQELPDEQRIALVMRVLDDRSYDEISKRLGCSQQTARQRVSRGLRALRSRIEPELKGV